MYSLYVYAAFQFQCGTSKSFLWN